MSKVLSVAAIATAFFVAFELRSVVKVYDKIYDKNVEISNQNSSLTYKNETFLSGCLFGVKISCEQGGDCDNITLLEEKCLNVDYQD